MTQLGEMVAVGVMKLEGSDCPFDHDAGDPPTVTNVFKGSGSTLGTNMEGACTTVTHPPNRRSPPAADPYPPDPPGAPTPVLIDGNRYPVTCAAHHLIPAAGSLRDASALMDWIDKEEGVVWANAGYDVNGVENGVWLPGNYAVGGNGTGEWTRMPSILPDDEHASAPPLPPLPPPAAGDSKLHGYRHDFDEGRKGAYVLQATRLYNAQFHDSHGDYNRFVQGILVKLGMMYTRKHPFAAAHCPDCKKLADKQEKQGKPTPFRIVHQMNSISKKMRFYLAGSRGHATVYTSRWGQQAERKGLSLIR